MSEIRLLHPRESDAIAFAGSTVVKIELVDDRWLRYTVKGDPEGPEHCVGIRVRPLFSREELDAISEASEHGINLSEEEAANLH